MPKHSLFEKSDKTSKHPLFENLTKRLNIHCLEKPDKTPKSMAPILDNNSPQTDINGPFLKVVSKIALIHAKPLYSQ